jgi:hypothetical protein
MQLRNGKITNANKKDTLVGEIKKRQNMVDRVSAGETPSRVAAIKEVFNIILDNIQYIMSDEFQPNGKFVQAVYNKTFIMANDANFSVENYICLNKPRNKHVIRRQMDDFLRLLDQVKCVIKINRPQIRAPYGYKEYDVCRKPNQQFLKYISFNK